MPTLSKFSAGAPLQPARPQPFQPTRPQPFQPRLAPAVWGDITRNGRGGVSFGMICRAISSDKASPEPGDGSRRPSVLGLRGDQEAGVR